MEERPSGFLVEVIKFSMLRRTRNLLEILELTGHLAKFGQRAQKSASSSCPSVKCHQIDRAESLKHINRIATSGISLSIHGFRFKFIAGDF